MLPGKTHAKQGFDCDKLNCPVETSSVSSNDR